MELLQIVRSSRKEIHELTLRENGRKYFVMYNLADLFDAPSSYATKATDHSWPKTKLQAMQHAVSILVYRLSSHSQLHLPEELSTHRALLAKWHCR